MSKVFDSSLDLGSQISSETGHIETAGLPKDELRQELALETITENIDEETAQFTDASIVISEEMNQEIKSWVSPVSRFWI
jgi:hypothetical protein